MVIQRIQSVYLLLAALLLGALCFIVPVGTVQYADPAMTHAVYLKDYPALLPLALVTAVLLIIDIFLYKNLRRQMLWAGVCVVLMVALACIGAFVLVARMPADVSVTWIGPAMMLAAAIILALLARGGMKADERVLKSYDHIR